MAGIPSAPPLPSENGNGRLDLDRHVALALEGKDDDRIRKQSGGEIHESKMVPSFPTRAKKHFFTNGDDSAKDDKSSDSSNDVKTPIVVRGAFEVEMDPNRLEDNSSDDDKKESKDLFTTEVLQTEVTWFCKLIVKRPALIAFLSMLLPILCSVIAFTFYSFSVDVSLDSFRIRDHHTAVTEDAVKAAGLDSETAWAAYNEWKANEDGDEFKRVDIVAGPPRSTRDTTMTDESSISAFTTNNSSDTGRRLLQSSSSYSSTSRARVRWQVHVIYTGMPSGKNILTATHLNQARKLENKLMAVNQYTQMCWQGVSQTSAYFNGCQPPNSIVPFFFDRIDDGGDGARTFYDALSVSSRIAGDGAYAYVDKSFDSETGTAAGLRSDFLFAAPVPGFSNSEQNKPGQAAAYREWVGGNVFPVLKKQAMEAKVSFSPFFIP